MKRFVLGFVMLVIATLTVSWRVNNDGNDVVHAATTERCVVNDCDCDWPYYNYGTTDVIECEKTGEGFVQDRDKMISEVVTLWKLFFSDDGAKAGDVRREFFETYAEYLVDAVIMYQNNPTDIGGQLPMHDNVHLLIATMVSLESSVKHDVVGSRGEVGLLQVMPNGPAIAGYAPEKVQHNARLGLLLGVRWLASRVPMCKQKDLFGTDWDDYDWLGPLSVYAGGGKAVKKDGTCSRYNIARERVDKSVMYRTRINYELSKTDG